MILVEGGMHAHAQVLPKGFYESCEASAGHEKWSSPGRMLVLFQICGDARTGFIQSAPANI